MTQMLASVQSVDEAMLALTCGADIIDIKNPHAGALGALPLEAIEEIVKGVGQRKPVSATIGDMPMQPDLLVPAVARTAATGVDIVKAGFFGEDGHEICLRALAPLAKKGVHIVAVLFADANPDLGLLPRLAAAGFYGVMLDTARKNGRRLGECLDQETLYRFVDNAHAHGMLTGLAGSLAIPDIPALTEFGADYLGFRGALCSGSDRQAGIDRERLLTVAKVLQECNSPCRNFD